MTQKEYNEAFLAVCDAIDAFSFLAYTPTLEARNISYHRQRLLDCLNDWFKSTATESEVE